MNYIRKNTKSLKRFPQKTPIITLRALNPNSKETKKIIKISTQQTQKKGKIKVRIIIKKAEGSLIFYKQK